MSKFSLLQVGYSVLLSAMTLGLLMAPLVFADNSQANHPVRVEMTGHLDHLGDDAKVERFLQRMLTAFRTDLALQDIRLRPALRRGADMAWDVYAKEKHLGTYRIWSRPESFKGVLLINSR